MKAEAQLPKPVSDKALVAWFRSQGWKPLPVQREMWRHYARGESGLLHTPTGSGKTLAVFGGPLLEALASSPSSPGRVVAERARRQQPGAEDAARSVSTSASASAISFPKAKRDHKTRTLKVLWITPLKALAVDSVRALREPIEGLGLDWQVGLRTGDASARDKRLARSGKLDVLVTTPESL